MPDPHPLKVTVGGTAKLHRNLTLTLLTQTINAVKRSINQLERKLSSRLDTLDAEVTEIR